MSKRAPAKPKRGRKPLAPTKRKRHKVMASFTDGDYAAVKREAERVDLTVAELVAERALVTIKR